MFLQTAEDRQTQHFKFFAFLAAIIIDNEYFVGCNLQHHHKMPQNPTNQTFRHAGYVKWPFSYCYLVQMLQKHGEATVMYRCKKKIIFFFFKFSI